MKIVQSGGHDNIGFTNIIIHVLTGLSIIMSNTALRWLLSFTKHNHKEIKTLHKLEIM